jgi:hypothetical protein
LIWGTGRDRAGSVHVQRRNEAGSAQSRARCAEGKRRTTWLMVLLALIAVGPEPAKAAPLAHEFYMTRGVFASPTDGDDWGPRWAMDFPEAEMRFLVALRRLTRIDSTTRENPKTLDDPSLGDYPFLYMVEVGAMRLDDEERDGLRNYLLAGGFLVIDDFWGTWAWDGLTVQLRELFPELKVVDVPLDHPVFSVVHDIRTLVQVPNVALAGTGRTHEYDGYTPKVRGVFDENGRLIVLINWNTDLGDAWEWADDERYPLRYSNYAFKLGVNLVAYALMH